MITRHADTPDFTERFGQLLEALALPVQHVVMVAENQMPVIARTAQAFDMHDGLLKTPRASAAYVPENVEFIIRPYDFVDVVGHVNVMLVPVDAVLDLHVGFVGLLLDGVVRREPGLRISPQCGYERVGEVSVRSKVFGHRLFLEKVKGIGLAPIP